MKNLFIILLLFVSTSSYGIDQDTFVDLDGGDVTDSTLLHDAIEENNCSLYTRLIENGADVNRRNSDGATPLIYSIMNYRFDFFALLIRDGADVHIQDIRGYTPLHWAVLRDKKYVKLLLKKGANVNTEENYGYTPLDFVCIVRNFEIAHLLTENRNEENICVR